VQFTISPSVHGRTKRAYRWEVAPWDLAPPVAPDWLLHIFAPPPERAKPARPCILTEDRARRSLARAVDQLVRTGAGDAIRRSTVRPSQLAASLVPANWANRRRSSLSMPPVDTSASMTATARPRSAPACRQARPSPSKGVGDAGRG
jgi:hypothetical protein